MKSLFISKELEPNSVLLSWCKENSIYVEGKSFLTFEGISIEKPQEEIYFFTSKRAVFYFLQEHFISEQTKIACVGKATASELEKLGYTIDFIGKSSGDPVQVAQDLISWSENNKIALIGALEGSDTIFNQIPKGKAIKYPVYKTTIHSMKLDEFDCYVFTSPSNFKGFINENQISEKSKVVAWGETTKKFLNHYSIQVDLILNESSETELIKGFEKLF